MASRSYSRSSDARYSASVVAGPSETCRRVLPGNQLHAGRALEQYVLVAAQLHVHPVIALFPRYRHQHTHTRFRFGQIEIEDGIEHDRVRTHPNAESIRYLCRVALADLGNYGQSRGAAGSGGHQQRILAGAEQERGGQRSRRD